MMIDLTLLDSEVLFLCSMIFGCGSIVGYAVQRCHESYKKLQKFEGEERFRKVFLSEGAD